MVRTLAWKHDIAKGGKTPFYHSVRFAPSPPVKHAICPRHRSSCWLIECDRAIHTVLPIRHHLLQKKDLHCSTVTGCQEEGTNLHRASAMSLPVWGGQGAKVRGLGRETRLRHPREQKHSCTLLLSVWRWSFKCPTKALSLSWKATMQMLVFVLFVLLGKYLMNNAVDFNEPLRKHFQEIYVQLI